MGKAVTMILLPLYSKMLSKVNTYEDGMQNSLQLKHQVQLQPMHISSSNTEGTDVVEITVFLLVDNVQKRCKTSLTSFLGLLASTVST